MADTRGQAYQERLAALIGLYGESVPLVRGGEDHPVQGVCVPTDGQEAGTFYDANEAVGLLRPALSLYVMAGASDVPTPNDVFYRDGRLLTVRKTFAYRLADTPLLLLALCD